ncbi:MAG: FAD-dependent pyridine nucleotide-disulfide oxidoreductase [Candidatus Magnetoglobus multicellularis str. Araruama]|uniref:FAD-dependent pyridine nucleotide-disulfide oxidoreductase n=1 Tax=Candidatus Magnetoglobus multicellularis str. Araruama TaxID=890399 RepID=A0A1V1PH94_9BACT|nr:MAG: FAD-dependent pyridine nucleotide-disulfide oxidoreductase [Candidatus Magnetoglobus multicellularis str. Araruama]
MKYIIIGNGIAGVHAAESIRRIDTCGTIQMISDETTSPYSRPMISHVLAGVTDSQKIHIRPPNFYAQLNIEPLFGKRITQIDIPKKQIHLDANTLDYDRLLIASGADPRPINAEGQDLQNIFFMRTVAQVLQIKKALLKTKRALVLGGGLVGFKAAYGLMHRGIPVTMIIGSQYPLSMQVDPTAGHLILESLRKKGLDVRVGLSVTSFEGKQTVQGAFLSDGTHLSCDLVIIGKGVLPSKAFISDNDIQTQSGILVDQHMTTNIPDIFAAGDVAQCYDIVRQSPWINAIWPEAVLQGRIAGANMAGKSLTHKGSLGRNVIRMFDLDILTAGLVNPPDNSSYIVISDHNARNRYYRKFVFNNNRLIGVVMVNNIEQGGLFVSLIVNQIPIQFPLKNFLTRTFNFGKMLKK